MELDAFGLFEVIQIGGYIVGITAAYVRLSTRAAANEKELGDLEKKIEGLGESHNYIYDIKTQLAEMKTDITYIKQGMSEIKKKINF